MAARRPRTYNAEAILAHGGFTFETRKFLVKWEGYTHEENTMEPFEHIRDCLAFQTYWPNRLDPASVQILSHEGNERNIYEMTFDVEWKVFRYEPNGERWQYFIHTKEPYDNVVGKQILEDYWNAHRQMEGSNGHNRGIYLSMVHQDRRYALRNRLAGTNIRDRRNGRRLPYVQAARALTGIREPDYRECATCNLWLPSSYFRDERVLYQDRGDIRQTIHCRNCNPAREDHLDGFIVYDDGSDRRGVDYEADPDWSPRQEN